LINSATFAAMIVALRGMDPARLASQRSERDEDAGVRAAIRYVRGEPRLAIPLAMMAVVGTLAFNFQVLLPLLGRFTFGGGAAAYTALAVAMAVGSVSGALVTGARGAVSERMLVGACAAFGGFTLLAAAAPSLPLAMAALVPLGAVSVTFAAGINSTLQLEASPAMRGRVMALYSVVFLGSTPIGAPIVGWLADQAGPRAGLALGGLAALAASAGGAIAFARRRRPSWRLGEAIRERGVRAPLAGLGRRGRGRLHRRGAVAVEAGSADQAHGLQRRRRLDVEAHSVALLDRGDRRLAATPGERDQDCVAGADRGHLGPDPADRADDQGEASDRPEAKEGDPTRALGRQAGGSPRTREHAGHRLGRP
jgi:hypothetical protein